MQLAHYLGLLHRAEQNLAAGFRAVAEAHAEEVDVAHLGRLLARQCDAHVERLASYVERYGEDAPAQPDRLHAELFHGPRSGGLGLLRDLHDLYLEAANCDIAWTLIGQAAKGARDDDLGETVEVCETETATQMLWLKTRMKDAAPQALVVS